MNGYKYKYYKYLNKIAQLGGQISKLIDIGEVDNNSYNVTFFSALLKNIFDKRDLNDTSMNSIIKKGHIKNIQTYLKMNRHIYIIDFANIIGILFEELSGNAEKIKHMIYNFVNIKVNMGHIVIIVHKRILNIDMEKLFDNSAQYLKDELAEYLEKKLFIMLIDINRPCQSQNSIDDLIFWLINISIFDIAYTLNEKYVKQIYFLTNDKQKMEKPIFEYVVQMNNCNTKDFQMYTVVSENSKDSELLFLRYLFTFIYKAVNDPPQFPFNELEIRNQAQATQYNDLNKLPFIQTRNLNSNANSFISVNRPPLPYSQDQSFDVNQLLITTLLSQYRERSLNNITYLFYKFVYYIQYRIFGVSASFDKDMIKMIILEPEKSFHNNNSK